MLSRETSEYAVGIIFRLQPTVLRCESGESLLNFLRLFIPGQLLYFNVAAVHLPADLVQSRNVILPSPS